MGVGFPPFRGGALKYADTVGMKTILDKCAKYAHLGKLYEPTESMKKMAADRKSTRLNSSPSGAARMPSSARKKKKSRREIGIAQVCTLVTYDPTECRHLLD